MVQNYQAILRVLFGINWQHFTQVKDITTTVKAMFLRNNGDINESQRANVIWSIHCDSRALFGTIETASDLHNRTGPKASIESVHALIGTNIDMDL